MRFAPDKRPYKTNAGAHFRHEVGRDAHAPGFYLHLEPGRVFVASGVWHPDRHALTQIRDAIVAHPKRWQHVISSKAFRATGSLGGDSLTRHPSGYDPEHPLRHSSIPEDTKLEDLRMVAMEDGIRKVGSPALPALAKRASRELGCLPEGTLRFMNPHRYRVALSPRLHELRMRLIEEARTP